MSVHIKAKLIKKEKLKEDIYKFSVETEEIAKTAKPGQFLEIRVQDKIEPLLRRPISIYNIEGNKVEFIFQVRGKGTEILAEKEEGQEIDILGPLGSGTFSFAGKKNIAIIGGGIGIFPLYELAKQAKTDTKINMYLGFRSKDFVTLEEEYRKVSDKFVLTTDDGSYGEKGFAINFLKEDIEKEAIDGIYACGPLPMLKAVQQLAKEKNIPCQISLEERMGCGIGVCLGCAVQINAGDQIVYGHVCKGGPVFDASTVII